MDIIEKLLQLVGTTFVQITITALVIIVIQILIRQFIAALIRSAIKPSKYVSPREEKQREDTLISIFRTASAVFLWIAGIFIVLNILNVNITAILTGAGLIGVLVGFGAQSTIKDFLSGFFVILENQYRVNDIVIINKSGNQISGQVEALTIRITKLRDLDGTVHIISNGEIRTVSNMTLGYSNVNLDISVPYGTNVKKLQTIIDKLGEELLEEPDWKDKIIEPIKFLRVDMFAESAMTVKLLGKVQPAEQWDVAGEYRKRLMQAFQKNNIDIPYPQRVVHQVKN